MSCIFQAKIAGPVLLLHFCDGISSALPAIIITENKPLGCGEPLSEGSISMISK